MLKAGDLSILEITTDSSVEKGQQCWERAVQKQGDYKEIGTREEDAVLN